MTRLLLLLTSLLALLAGCPAADGPPGSDEGDPSADDDDDGTPPDDDDDDDDDWGDDDDTASDDDDAMTDDDDAVDDDDVADDDDAWGDDDDDAASDDDDAADDDDAMSDDDDSFTDDDDATGDDDDATGDDPLDGEDITCDEFSEEPTLWYVSADDSNSQADGAHLRGLIEEGLSLSSYGPFRPYELFNYYSWDFPSAPPGQLRLEAQMRADEDDPELFSLVVGVTAPAMSEVTRPDLNLTFTVDTSCSMNGEGILNEQAALQAMASQLRAGDIVSVVEWSATSALVIDSRPVTGPTDTVLTDYIDGLSSGGGTNLSGGLQAAYLQANANYDPEKLNRVVLISDGGANIGPTDGTLIGSNAEDAENEGIYLIGIGTPPHYQYNDQLMNDVTDLGKGAYIYIDEPSEAWHQLTGSRFLSNVALAAKDVRLEMTLPPGFATETFYGEQISQNASEVEPQHLGPNDSMMYVQTVRDCSADAESAEALFEFTVTWQDLATGADMSETISATRDELLTASARELYKVSAVVAYVDAANEVYSLPYGQRLPYMDGVWSHVNTVLSSFPADEDLQEILYLTGQLRSQF